MGVHSTRAALRARTLLLLLLYVIRLGSHTWLNNLCVSYCVQRIPKYVPLRAEEYGKRNYLQNVT